MPVQVWQACIHTAYGIYNVAKLMTSYFSKLAPSSIVHHTSTTHQRSSADESNRCVPSAKVSIGGKV